MMRNELLINLLKRTGEGEHDAFTDLYKLTQPRLYGVAFKIIGRKELADETVQEAFVQIWLNAAKYEPNKAQALTWMISITRFRALDCFRGQKRRQELQLTEFHLPVIVEQCPTITHEHQLLRVKIDKLQSKQADPLRLVYYLGLTHQEVTHHMGVPLGTVKGRIRRSLADLRQTMVA